MGAILTRRNLIQAALGAAAAPFLPTLAWGDPLSHLERLTPTGGRDITEVIYRLIRRAEAGEVVVKSLPAGPYVVSRTLHWPRGLYLYGAPDFSTVLRYRGPKGTPLINMDAHVAVRGQYAFQGFYMEVGSGWARVY